MELYENMYENLIASTYGSGKVQGIYETERVRVTVALNRRHKSILEQSKLEPGKKLFPDAY